MLSVAEAMCYVLFYLDNLFALSSWIVFLKRVCLILENGSHSLKPHLYFVGGVYCFWLFIVEL